MRDRLGREIEYLRISVTQGCNLKCIYCIPEGQDCVNNSCMKLTPLEFETIVKSMVSMGIKKVRITGGEPLIRADICEIISGISNIQGIEDISMTTNGIKLDELAEKLKNAGLKRINISLDSFKEERFKYMTGGGRLNDVLKGIKKALYFGLQPIRLNTVLIKGVNDEEIDNFIGFAKDNPVDVRFIELMPVGRFGEQNMDKIIFNSDIIAAHPQLCPCEDENNNHPAKYYTIKGYKGRIGFISPMSHKFCGCCNRIRITCDGKIKPCLGDNGEVDIIEVLRNTPDELEEFIRKAIYNKPEGHNFHENFSSNRNMSMIGG